MKKGDIPKGKAPTATQLPSGNWRCRASYTDEDGKIHKGSFTESKPEIAIAKAIAWKAGILKEIERQKDVTLDQAITEYLESLEASKASPSTIRDYESRRKNSFPLIINKKVSKLTLLDIQRQMDARAKVVAPKTVHNDFALLSPILGMRREDLNLKRIRLPEIDNEEMAIPTYDEAIALMDAAKRRKGLYCAVLLAITLGLRRSEICALEWKDIDVVSDIRHVRVATSKDFENWTKVADTTYIYDYTINFLNVAQFFSNFGTMQSTMQYMHDIGITGYIYNCGDGHYAAFNELRNYLLCKLQWDVNADVVYHMMDFMNEYYGEEAAPYLKEILDIQAAQTKATAHAFDFDWHYQAGFYPFYKVNKLDSLWKKALNADITEEQRFNVEVANLSWEYFKANQFIGKYSFLNPGRLKANEELYDNFKAHGVDRVSSFGTIPADKSEIDFMLRPFNWG